jgi:divinyl chlorophyllide a 8-vinyl-reductase
MSTSSDKKRVVIVGATGYIGKFVVRESVRRGYETVAVSRTLQIGSKEIFDGAEIVVADVTDENSLKKKVFDKHADAVINCLASRTGSTSDSELIDYQASLNVLNAARDVGIRHYVLLSAICVRKPLLAFQRAKLKIEAALQNQADIKYSIVRPTAFFKSVSGQMELLREGKPFVMFGDGELCKCNPIAETDLAEFMLNCLDEKDKWDKILEIGGPDAGMTMKQQGEMIFEVRSLGLISCMI